MANNVDPEQMAHFVVPDPGGKQSIWVANNVDTD